MNNQSTVGLLALLLTSAEVSADSIPVQAEVYGEDGAMLSSVHVRADDVPVEVSDAGQFTVLMDRASSSVIRVEISAPGYYSALHTLHRSDFVGDAPARLPAIELVRRQAGRRLLMFAGDAMLSRRYFEPRGGERVLARKGSIEADSRALLQHVKPYVELADYASVNLETQLSEEKLGNPLPKSVTFYSPPALAEALQWAGFDYVALGNNHMYDFQEEGLQSTFAALNSLDMDYSGGGFSDSEARAPAIVDIEGLPHALLSYVGWPGTFSPSQVAEDSKGGAALGSPVSIAEDLAGISNGTTGIVQLHAGLEYAAQPALSERTTLRRAVRDGADLVIGHHAHVLQGFEIVDQRLVAYSMGNFLFDQYHYTTQMGMLLFVWMDGEELHQAEVVPLHINGYVPTPATGAFRSAVLHRLAKLSDPASVCMRPNGVHARVTSCDESAPHQTLTGVSDGPRPVELRDLGINPMAPVQVQGPSQAYRLGVDILRRGDFDHVGLFGTSDRSWIVSANAGLVTTGDPHLQIEVPSGGSVRTGQRVFERVFTLSNPATVSGRVSATGDARLRVSLQRRGVGDGLEEALADGPITELGTIHLKAEGPDEFVFDYVQPRLSTRSVRLLFEVDDLSADGVTVLLDDLAWVEWRTPWLNAGDRPVSEFATHVQFVR